MGIAPPASMKICHLFKADKTKPKPVLTNNLEVVMNTKTEGTLAIIASLFVLMSAMLDPRISVILSVAALLGLGIYKLVQKQ